MVHLGDLLALTKLLQKKDELILFRPTILGLELR